MMDYNAVAVYCKKNWKEFSEHVIRIADEVCENKFIFDMEWDMERTFEVVDFKDKINWDYALNGDPEFTWQFNRHRFFIILGQAYKLTENEKYVANFVRLLNDWIDNCTLEKDPKKARGWRTLEIGLRGEYWTKAMEYFKDSPLITKELYVKFANSLKKQAEILIQCTANRFVSSNWGVIQDHGLLDIALYLGKEYVPEDYIKFAIDKLLLQSQTQLMGGVHWEQSPMYHTEVLLCFVDAIIAMRKNSIDPPKKFLENTKRMAEIISLWKRPNHHQPMMGDSDDTDVRDVMSLTSLVFDEPKFKFVGRTVLDYESAWLFGMTGVAEYDRIKPQEIDTKSVALSNSGNFFMRSGYEEDANYLHFINGFTGAGHAHSDKLHFDLVINGEDILTDCGRYTYVPSKMRFYLKSPKAHNTITVDNEFFIKNLASGWSYSKLAPSVSQGMIIEDKVELVRGAHLGYMRILGSIFVDRRILWIKPNIYVVIDMFKGKGIHSYQEYFNFARTGKVTLDGNKATFVGEKAKAHFYFLKNKAKIIKKEGFISTNYNKYEKIEQLKMSFLGVRDTSSITVIVGEKAIENNTISIEKVPVKGGNGAQLSNCIAEGIKIKYNEKEYNLIVSYEERMEVLSIDKNMLGMGKLILFEKNEGKLLNLFN